MFYKRIIPLLMMAAMTVAVGCGDDDGVTDYDRDFTQVKIKVAPAFDLQKLYTIRASYTDFKGVKHNDVIENTSEWVYSEKENGDHPISFMITATAKTPEEYGPLDRALYAFTWEYSIHWYKQSSGAKSIQPEAQGRAVKREEVETYMAENPVITLINFNKP